MSAAAKPEQPIDIARSSKIPRMPRAAFNSSHSWWYWIGAAGLILLLDHIIKHEVVTLMPYGANYSITSFFNWVHVRNTGAAFSFLADAGGWQRYAFSVLGIGVSIVLAWLLRRGVNSRLDATAYTLIMGGAMGNVVDRLARGSVVDYLDFHMQGWHWPAFNLADVGITLGACALIIAALRPSPRPPSQSVSAAECAPPPGEHK